MTIDEMTPAELNEAIAKAKGFMHLEPPAMPAWQKPTDHGVEALFQLPNWSGDYNAAMSLLDDEVHYYDIQVTPYSKLCVISETFGGHGDSVPCAICRAYLRWCEARKEKE